MDIESLPVTMAFNSTSEPNGSASCLVEPQHLSIMVFLCLVFFLGLLLNIFSLWVFTCRISKWSPGTVLQFHLAISDVIVSPVAPLLAVYFSFGSHWPLGSFLCKLKIALLTIHFYGSIFFLTLISVHRYFAVVHFNRVTRMKRKEFVQKLCAGIWLVVLLNGVACFVLLDTSIAGSRTLCLSIHQSQHINMYFTMNFVFVIPGFLIPFTVSLVCYSRLVNSVSRINTNTWKGQVIKTKSCKMVAVCLVIFGLCFMPMNIVRTVGVVFKKFFPNQCKILLKIETAYYVSWILAGANCCLDPLIYCFGSQNFTKVIRTSLRHVGAKFWAVPEENRQDCPAVTTQTCPSTMTMSRENMSCSNL